MYRLRILTAALVLGCAAVALAVSPVEAAAKPIPCTATMSNASPPRFTTTDVRVSSWGDVAVTTVAHYKTKNTTRSATTNNTGRATVPYYISGASAGYRVVVTVSVRKDGRSGSCRTSFTPLAG
jgi:hypothetical protein